MQKCFIEKIGYTIAIGNISGKDQTLAQSIFFSYVPIILVDTDKNIILHKNKRFRNIHNINETTASQKVYPVTNAAIIASSSSELMVALNNLRDSIWWNAEAFFLIVNTKKNGCELANEFLNLLWIFNILSAIFICVNSNYKLLLFTFNPYSKTAPIFWEVVKNADSQNDPWSLLKHQFDESLYSDCKYLKLNFLIFISSKEFLETIEC